MVSHRDPYCVLYQLLNMYLRDIFYFSEDLGIASYADDTTIYTVNETKKKNQSLVHQKHFDHFSLDGLITTL